MPCVLVSGEHHDLQVMVECLGTVDCPLGDCAVEMKGAGLQEQEHTRAGIETNPNV